MVDSEARIGTISLWTQLTSKLCSVCEDSTYAVVLTPVGLPMCIRCIYTKGASRPRTDETQTTTNRISPHESIRTIRHHVLLREGPISVCLDNNYILVVIVCKHTICVLCLY